MSQIAYMKIVIVSKFVFNPISAGGHTHHCHQLMMHPTAATHHGGWLQWWMLVVGGISGGLLWWVVAVGVRGWQ